MSEQANPTPEPAPTPVAPPAEKKPWMHDQIWHKFSQGFVNLLDSIVQTPSLLLVYPLSFAYAFLASTANLATFKKPKFKEDMRKATVAIPEWPKRVAGFGMLAYGAIALL